VSISGNRCFTPCPRIRPDMSLVLHAHSILFQAGIGRPVRSQLKRIDALWLAVELVRWPLELGSAGEFNGGRLNKSRFSSTSDASQVVSPANVSVCALTVGLWFSWSTHISSTCSNSGTSDQNNFAYVKFANCASSSMHNTLLRIH
jgi:hypothetical protein